MFTGDLAGCIALLLALLPGIIAILASMPRSDVVGRGKRLIAFLALTLNLVAILGFLESLYVKPAFAKLSFLYALPSLTRFVFNPWFDSIFILISMLILCAVIMMIRKPLRRSPGFSMITMVTVITALCMWVLGSIFHYGLTGRMLAGGQVLSKMLVPLHSLIAFFLFFIVITGLYARYVRQGKRLWLLSVFLIFCGLCAYHSFAWYLPTFPLPR